MKDTFSQEGFKQMVLLASDIASLFIKRQTRNIPIRQGNRIATSEIRDKFNARLCQTNYENKL